MILIYNLPGLIAAAAGIGVGAAMGFSTKMPVLSLAAGCATAFAVDIWMRLQSRESNRWASPDEGAALYYVPVYILSIVAFVVGLLFSMNII